MKVAVLGANGYLGRFLCRSLRIDQYDVLPITRATIDLSDYSAVKNWLKINRPESVINCATSINISNVRDNEINYEDLRNNINIFLNFYNNDNLFNKFVNIGSGAEFDKRNNITESNESDILTAQPIDSYGYSKNLISRLVLTNDKFYTLRLFGCFDVTEPPIRLFHKLKTETTINLEDKQFDYFSAQDFYKVVTHYLNNHNLHRDINCVYKEKLSLSDVIRIFKYYHNTSSVINITGVGKNYTGNGSKLSETNIELKGLVNSIKEYK
jgi:dTDP-4-dehydrorhamnose reductase